MGYPIILKPRDGAGASATWRVDKERELEHAMHDMGVIHGHSIAVEEFIEGHEGFYDTMTAGGNISHEFISHYYPNVLEAMRTRWISPVIIHTNRMDAPGSGSKRSWPAHDPENGTRHSTDSHGMVFWRQRSEIFRNRSASSWSWTLGYLLCSK